MSKFRIVVPSWSPLSVDMQAETGSKYPAFIQLGGQPLYAYIIRLYESIKQHAEIIFILPEVSPELDLKNFADFNVKTLRLSASKNIGDTVRSATSDLSAGQSLVVHMADTLLSAPDLGAEEDVIYVQSRSDLYRWTSVSKDVDGSIRIITDRDPRSAGCEQKVCVGVFVLRDGALFANHLRAALAVASTDMDPFFSAIQSYSCERAIELRTPASWFDCGHIDSYYESRLNYHNLRHFNTLSYDSERGLVTKRSRNLEAFRHQVRWFKQVPDELASFLPRIFDSSDGDSPHITMELLSIPTLGDLLVNKRLQIGAWNDVAKKILHVQTLLNKYSFASTVAEKIVAEVYLGKTRKRIRQFIEQRPEALKMWVVNADKKTSLNEVLSSLDFYAEKMGLLKIDALAPIHGDMCFSNLMYDPRGRQIKLIDPRGEFGPPGIYGDARYDKAKLMHSYAGAYDFIVSDLFDVSVAASGELSCSIERDEYHQKVTQIFDSILFLDSRDRQQCEAIQALLFLSMLPLHSDKPDRQLAMLNVGLTQYAKNLMAGEH